MEMRQANVRDGREHALVDGKEQIGDLGAAHGGSCQHVPETNVIQISNEGIGAFRKGERIAPEEPLKRHHAHRHTRQPY